MLFHSIETAIVMAVWAYLILLPYVYPWHSRSLLSLSPYGFAVFTRNLMRR